MKRILLCTFGSFGDLHPYLALALELKARGHQPAIATSGLYRQKVTELGIDFVAVRPDLPAPAEAAPMIEKIMHDTRGTEFLFKEVLMPALRDGYEDLEPVIGRFDGVVTHPLAYAAQILAEKLNLPRISTVLAPISIWSAYDPPVPPVAPRLTNLKRLGPFINRLLMQLPHRVTASWVEPVQELRHEAGLPRGPHPMFEGQFAPGLTLALFSPVLAPPQPDWPPHTVATGFCFFDKRGTVPGAQDEAGKGGDELTLDLEQFLQTGPPPVVFTLGSSAIFSAGDFYEVSVAATAKIGQRAVLLIGDERNRPAKLPCNICVATYAPHSQIFARAGAIVHQGGIGTTGQALRAGKPQLIMPFSHDQPDNGNRIRRLGAGEMLSRRDYTVERVARTLKSLLDTPDYTRKAAAIGERVRAENGPVTACDAIEEFLERQTHLLISTQP